MSAMTRSEISKSWNMSSRMLPAATISPVVRPWMPVAARTGSISSCSTLSKSMPAFVPKGRMMNARMWGCSLLSFDRGYYSCRRTGALSFAKIQAARLVPADEVQDGPVEDFRLLPVSGMPTVLKTDSLCAWYSGGDHSHDWRGAGPVGGGGRLKQKDAGVCPPML